jgi:hypothetical protein
MTIMLSHLDNDITDAGAEALAEAISAKSSLVLIDLTGTDLTLTKP